MTIRNVLIILLILVLLSHFVGMPFHVGGPVGLVLFILLIIVLVGAM